MNKNKGAAGFESLKGEGRERRETFESVLGRLPSFYERMSRLLKHNNKQGAIGLSEQEEAQEELIEPKYDEEMQRVYDAESDLYYCRGVRDYNMSLETPFLATGQNGYFAEQIAKNGFTKSLLLREQDEEDARFISECFRKKPRISRHLSPNAFTTLPGTTELNYARQSFPAGIYEDVLQCSVDHDFPIPPKVGESEADYWCRVLSGKLSEIEDISEKKKKEAMGRGTRLISNFCKIKNRVYFIPIKNIQGIKASFGDVSKDRDVSQLFSFEEMTEQYAYLEWNGVADEQYMRGLYNNANYTGEFGVALYGAIPREGIKYIEVDRAYDILQKRAAKDGLKPGDEIPI